MCRRLYVTSWMLQKSMSHPSFKYSLHLINFPLWFCFNVRLICRGIKWLLLSAYLHFHPVNLSWWEFSVLCWGRLQRSSDQRRNGASNCRWDVNDFNPNLGGLHGRYKWEDAESHGSVPHRSDGVCQHPRGVRILGYSLPKSSRWRWSFTIL